MPRSLSLSPSSWISSETKFAAATCHCEQKKPTNIGIGTSFSTMGRSIRRTWVSPRSPPSSPTWPRTVDVPPLRRIRPCPRYCFCTAGFSESRGYKANVRLTSLSLTWSASSPRHHCDQVPVSPRVLSWSYVDFSCPAERYD